MNPFLLVLLAASAGTAEAPTSLRQREPDPLPPRVPPREPPPRLTPEQTLQQQEDRQRWFEEQAERERQREEALREAEYARRMEREPGFAAAEAKRARKQAAWDKRHPEKKV